MGIVGQANYATPKVLLALQKYKIRRIFAQNFASFATTTSQVFAWGAKYVITFF